MINKENQKHKKPKKKEANIQIPSDGKLVEMVFEHERKCIGMMSVCELFVYESTQTFILSKTNQNCVLGLDGLTHACIEGSQLIRSRENKLNRQKWMERHDKEKT